MRKILLQLFPMSKLIEQFNENVHTWMHIFQQVILMDKSVPLRTFYFG